MDPYGYVYVHLDRHAHYDLYIQPDGDSYPNLDGDLYGHSRLDGHAYFIAYEYLDCDANVLSDGDDDGDLDGNRHGYVHLDHDLYAHAHGGDELGEDGLADEPEGGGQGSVRFDVARDGKLGVFRDDDGRFADGIDSFNGVVRFGTGGDGERQYNYLGAGYSFDWGHDGGVHGAGGSCGGIGQRVEEHGTRDKHIRLDGGRIYGHENTR